MSASQTVCHPGVVKEIHKDLIRVSILSQSACGSCRAKGACSLGESTEKMIDVFSTTDQSFSVGDEIQLVMNESTGLKALLFGYILPFLFLLIVLFTLSAITGNEKLAGLISVGTLIPYYISLSFFRKYLKKSFSFSIQKLENS
jgi:positive regulator of sigma E activity